MKESVPFLPPPPAPPAASPPTPKLMDQKKKVKGSKKPGKPATQSKKTDKKFGAQAFSTVVKTIKLSKTSNRFVLLSSLACPTWLAVIGYFELGTPVVLHIMTLFHSLLKSINL